MPALIRLAGAVAIEHGGRRAAEQDLGGRQPRLAFAVLVWEHGHAMSHDQLAEILWPYGPPSTWESALRGIVSRIRGLFDRVGLNGGAMVSGQAGRYCLALPEDAVVDVEDALATLQEAERLLSEGGVETARRLASEARSVLARPLLAGIDSPWLDRRREELAGAHIRSLELLGECRRLAKEYDHAARAVEDLLAIDQFRESAWRLLMQIHTEAGNAGQALLIYERCRRVLADELGADPSPETQELHARILRGAETAERMAAEAYEPEIQEPAGGRPAIVGAPYRGLEPFDEEHAPLFFGRDSAVGALLERLRVHRFVAVVGASGSGKSSLVRAGLLQALRSGALPDADTWRRVIVLPGHDPLKTLGAELLQARPHPDVQAAVDRFAHDPAALHEAASAILAGRPVAEQLLVVVDQFEELFTLCRDDAVRRTFVATLLGATRRIDARTVVVITMRADFYHRAARIPELAEALSSSQFVVTPLDGEGLEQAIRQPAQVAGVKFEEGLVGRILTDVAGEPGVLPLLQHALLELYEGRTDHVITRAVYEDIGGVSGALARRAEAVWNSFNRDEKEAARRILLRLTEPGEGTEDTRRRASLSELIDERTAASDVEAVVRELADARLVTTSAEPSTGTPYVEVAHEALIRGWPRLARWIDDNRVGLRIHRRLTDAAVQWSERDHHPDYLYTGTRLAEATDWATESDPDINPLEREFLEASAEAEHAARRRRTRLRRLVLTGLGAGLLMVGLLAVAALVERGRANEQEDLARSRRVAAEATGQLPVDPELSLLLAIQAYQIAPTAEAEAALRQAVVESHLRVRYRSPRFDPLVSVSPDGTFVATSSPGDVVTVWRSSTGQRLAHLRSTRGTPPDGIVDVITFSPDGTRLLASNMDGHAWIWSVPDGRLLTELRWPVTGVFCCGATDAGAGWSPDGGRVILSGADGAARIFEAANGRLLTVLRVVPKGTPAGLLARARFSPRRERVAVEGPNGEVRIFDGRTGRVITNLVGHTARLWSLKWSSNSKLLLTSSEDNTARIWDGSSGRLLRVLEHDAIVRDATFSPDSKRVITGDLRGGAALWDTATGTKLFDLAGHAARINKVRFSPNGRLALTASFDGTAGLWDVTSGERLALLTGTTQAIVTAEFTDDAHVITAGDDARLWEVPQGAVSAIAAHEAPLFDMAFSPDGRRLATGGQRDGLARIWDVDRGEQLAEMRHDPDAFVSIDVSSDGRSLLTSDYYALATQASNPDPPRLWDLRTARRIREFPVLAGDPLGVCGAWCPATRAALSPDGRMVAISSYDGQLRVFNTRTGRRVRVLTPRKREPFDWTEWSPDGRIILTIGRQFIVDYTPRMWDTRTWEELPPLPTEEGSTPTRPRFSRDGRFLAIHRGAVTKIYEVATRRVVAEFRHRGTARDAAFTRDGRLVVTASDAGASIWDLASQRRLADLPGHPGEVFAVRFTPDGRIATGGVDGVVRFFRCEVCQPVDELLEVARGRVTRGLTEAERSRFLGDSD
ncbi:MAG: hypothetical protein M3N24_11345 [Actinomycetota bacterium]|nr:hypothetical protein [Actinomycetota bacterium]